MSDDAPNAAAAASGEADADDFDILPTQMPPRFAQQHAQADAGGICVGRASASPPESASDAASSACSDEGGGPGLHASPDT